MQFDPRWLTVGGLVCDLIGAIVLATGLFISKKQAIELGVSRWAGETDEKNLRLPQVRDRLIQSRNARVGMVFFVLGFILQIAGSWPR